jgi:hypothetical protein
MFSIGLFLLHANKTFGRQAGQTGNMRQYVPVLAYSGELHLSE